MSVYLLSCSLSVLTMYAGLRAYSRSDDRSDPFWLVFFSALPMILVAAFRYNVGTDYALTYVKYFEDLQNGMLADKDRLEPLYHLLNVLVVALRGDFFWVTLVCALGFFLPVYAHILRDSPSPCLSIFLLLGMGFVFVSFNAMRQMVGCALLFFSLRYVEERRFFPFLVCVAAACGFHITCALFLPVFFLARVRIKPRLALLLTAILLLLSDVITSAALRFISTTKYTVYIASIFDTGKTAWVMLAINGLILLLMSIVYHEDEKYQIYFNLQLVSLWITLFSGKIVLLLRILWIFGLGSVIALPLALHRFENERDRWLLTGGVVLLYLVYFFYTVGVQNSNGVLPYQTIFREWLA